MSYEAACLFQASGMSCFATRDFWTDHGGLITREDAFNMPDARKFRRTTRVM